MQRLYTQGLVCLMALLLLGAAPARAQNKTLMMATTTHTTIRGFCPCWRRPSKRDRHRTQMGGRGTGKALEHGKTAMWTCCSSMRRCGKAVVDEGHGVNRTQVMYNDFILVGPAADPAKIKGKTAAQALAAIAAAKAPFVSRGDDSGTHKMEQKLWKNSGMAVPDKDPWYVSAGQGMMATLNMAAERKAYTLVDRGTYISYEDQAKGKPSLAILVEGDKPLLNQYSVISVNPATCKSVKFDLSETFRKWLASPAGQKVVGDYTLKGKKLFTPNAGKNNATTCRLAAPGWRARRGGAMNYILDGCGRP